MLLSVCFKIQSKARNYRRTKIILVLSELNGGANKKPAIKTCFLSD